jgi:hypothetical protein
MEMFGMLGGIAGGAFGYLGAMEQAEAQDRATEANIRINERNVQSRENERAQAIAMANKLRKEQQLGTTDIRGTRTQFIPGQGWVVKGAQGVLDIIALQDAEQKKVLQHDLPMRRSVMDRNYARGLEEEALADTYRRQLQNTYTPDDRALEADLYNAQAMGIREGSDDASRAAFTQAMRTSNNSRFGDVAAGLAREKSSAFAKAALTAKLMSRGSGQKEADTRRNSLANLYNLFATRAGALPDVGYKPQAISDMGTLGQSQQGDIATGTLAANMYAKKGGEYDYIPANMGYGNALAGLGSSIASTMRGMGAMSAQRGGVQGFGGTGGSDGETYQGGEGEMYS